MMDMNTIQIPSMGQRVVFYSLMENLMYWFTGSIVWIPWYFSDVFGIAAMIVVVPPTMAAAALFALKQVPVETWKKEIWLIIAVFVATTIVIDFFFWILWRGHAVLDWYLPITQTGTGNFIGYIEIVVISLIIYVVAVKSSRLQNLQNKYLSNLKSIAVLATVFFVLNVFFAIRYW